MEFLRERVYTSLNADELKAGDKVIVANTLKDLKSAVDTALYVYELTDILTESSEDRFFANDRCYLLAYLVERAENCTNCGCVHCWYREKHGIDEQRLHTCSRRIEPKTEQKAEKAPAWFVKGLMDGSIERTSDEAETPELISLGNGQYVERKRYRPFKDTDELIKVFCEKTPKIYDKDDEKLFMPYIWVRNKENKRVWLITEFDNRILDYLFTNCEFLDGSPCGVEE